MAYHVGVTDLFLGLVILGGVILLANIGVLALSFKLYTEAMKDRKMDRRASVHESSTDA